MDLSIEKQLHQDYGNPDNDLDFNDSIGISSERHQELADMLRDMHGSTTSLAELFLQISQKVTEVNELMYCAFKVGYFVKGQQENPLAALLRHNR
jgi:hypothetical protein